MAFTKAWPVGLTDLVSVLKASALNQIDANQSKSIDGVGGGTYSPTAAININNAAGAGLGNVDLVNLFTVRTGGILNVAAGALLRLSVGAAIPDADTQLDPAAGLIRQATVPTAGRNHYMVAAGNVGSFMFVVRPSDASTFTMNISRTNGGVQIVQLGNGSAWEACALYDDGTNWRLIALSGAATGAAAGAGA